MDLLRNRAGIECGRKDAILSGEGGYRFSDRLAVQFADQPTITDIEETGDVRDVRNDEVPDGAADKRRAWILQQLEQGHKLRAPAVVKEFRCHVKTAQRDLTSLKDEGKIEFVGAARTG